MFRKGKPKICHCEESFHLQINLFLKITGQSLNYLISQNKKTSYSSLSCDFPGYIKVFSESQFGFQKRTSTNTAVNSLINSIVSYIDQRSHEALCTNGVRTKQSRVALCRLDRIALECFRSYLGKIGQCLQLCSDSFHKLEIGCFILDQVTKAIESGYTFTILDFNRMRFILISIFVFHRNYSYKNFNRTFLETENLS